MNSAKAILFVVLFFSAAVFAGEKSLFLGPRFSMGMIGVWNNEKVKLLREDGSEIAKVDPFKNRESFDMEIGMGLLFKINGFFGVAAEANLGILSFDQMDNGVYREVYFDNMGYAHFKYETESITWFQLSIPLLARINPLDWAYAEAGCQFTFVFDSEHNFGDDEENEMGEWNPEPFRFAPVLGLGVEIPLTNSLLFDIGTRFELDVTQMENGKKLWIKKDSEYRESSSAKFWALQFYMAFYLV